MSTEKPTILLVTGAWHFPAGFDVVRSQLESLGYPTEAPALPSIGAEPANKDLSDDAAVVRAVLTRLVDEKKKIVLLMHSYGGVVGSSAVEDLGFAQRKKEGKEGGVITLVYMTAFALPKGVSLLDALGGAPLPWMNFQGDKCIAEDSANIFYLDLSPGDQQKWTSRLSHTCSAVFSGKATHEPWHIIPSMYIFCEEDKAIPLAAQQGIASSMGDIATFTIKASHSPFLSQPVKLVEGLELAAKIGLEKC